MKYKTPVYKSIKFKITFFVIAINLVIIAFLSYNSNKNLKEMIKMNKENLNQIAVDTVDRRFKVSYQILETALIQTSVNPLVADAIKLRDIERLKELVSVSFDKLKEVGVDEYHFSLPDNMSILNLYDHNKNQYDSTCERSIVKDINLDKDHLPIKGLEQCSHGLFLRYIAPIYDGNEFIGSVELGMQVENRILNIFKNVSGGEWYLYSIDGNSHSLMGSTEGVDQFSLIQNKEYSEALNNGLVFEIEEDPYIIQIIPLVNYKGQYKNYLKRIFDNSELIDLQSKYTRNNILYGALAAFIGTLLIWTIMKYFLNPLVYLEQKARKLESGILNEPIESKSSDEIAYLAGAMENMRQSLYKRETELKNQSYIDQLTGAYNRHYFEYQLKEVLKESSYPVTLIIADMDGLKEINDNEGHAVGDRYLVTCAKIMKSAMRSTDKLFRIGGDEFILLFPNTDHKIGEHILNRVKRDIEGYNKTLEKSDSVLSISFGMAVCENELDCLENAMVLADEKMYEEKKTKEKGKI